MGEERYNLEKAQEEAETLRKKVESGRASSYADAEEKKKKISELEPIEKSRGAIIRNREDLARLVEGPLLSACEELYDRNIITLGTSANKKDVEYPDYGAYIIIDFDTLSAKNQGIGRPLGEVYFADGGNQLKIIFPLSKDSTFEDVQTRAQEIAHKFVKQTYRVVTKTLEEMRKFYGYESRNESVQPESFKSEGYYWAPELGTFFMSEEQYKKAVERVDEDEKATE